MQSKPSMQTVVAGLNVTQLGVRDLPAPSQAG